MRKKTAGRGIALILALLMAGLLMIPSAAAQPSTGVDISYSADPAELSAAGTVLIAVTVKNPVGNATMTGVTIQENGQIVEELQDIEAGRNRTTNIEYDLSESQLGQALPLQLHYTLDGEQYSEAIPVVVKKISAAPSLEFTREVDRNPVEPGGTVNVTYKLRNAGNVAITNIQVKDDELHFNKKLDLLQVGDTQTLTHSLAVEANINSTPAVTFSAAGQGYAKTLDAMLISVAVPTVDIKTTCDQMNPAAGDTVTIKTEVVNRGNITLKNIEISDANLGVVHQAQQLEAGKSLSFEQELKIEKNQTVQFKLSAINTVTGSTFTTEGQPLNFQVKLEGNPVDLQVQVKADPAELEEPGTVKFTVEMKNYGKNALKDLVISEANSGELEKVTGELAAGETKTVEINLSVLKSQSYEFTVKAVDTASGIEGSGRAAPIAINVLSDQAQEGEEDQNGMMTALWSVLGVIAFLAVAAGVVLIILKRQQKKHGPKGPKPGTKGGRPQPAVPTGRVVRPVPDPLPEEDMQPDAEDEGLPQGPIRDMDDLDILPMGQPQPPAPEIEELQEDDALSGPGPVLMNDDLWRAAQEPDWEEDEPGSWEENAYGQINVRRDANAGRLPVPPIDDDGEDKSQV